MLFGTIIFENPGRCPVVAAVLLLLTFVSLWFYPRQFLGSGLFGWILPALRWLGIASLTLMLLHPVLMRSAQKSVGSQVLALIDGSKSMALTDSARTPAERVALARAFRALPADQMESAATPLLSQIRTLATYAANVSSAQNDLDYARLVGRGIGEKMTTLRERVGQYLQSAQALYAARASVASSSDLHQFYDLQKAPNPESQADWSELRRRISELEAKAAQEQAAADQNLYMSDEKVRRVCDQSSNQSRLALSVRALNISREALVSRGSEVTAFAIGPTLNPLEPEPGGGKTLEPSNALIDVGAAVSAAEAVASERPTRAILLFTDGHRGGRRSEIPSAIRPSGVPVYTINVASDRIKDAWISSISMSSMQVFRGQSIEGEVEVRYQGGVAPPSSLTIKATGSQVVVPLAPRPGRAGKPTNILAARFAIAVAPPPGVVDESLHFSIASAAGEATSENNTAVRWIKVYPTRLRVRIVSGGPSWDVQNLSHLLQRMPWVDLQTNMLASPDATLRLPAAQLSQDDIVILHDVPAHALDATQWDAIGRMVSERSGCAVIVAGVDGSLGDYSLQPLAAELLPFHDLRPVWRQWPGDQPAFHFNPALALRASIEAGNWIGDPRRWTEIPGLYRYLQIPTKYLFADAHPWLSDVDTGMPLILERRHNNGRIFFIGTDEMWRWGSNLPESPDRRLWEQIIRAGTSQRFLLTDSDVQFDVDRIAVQIGMSVRIRAWARGASLGNRQLQVEIQREGAAATALQLEARNGRFEAVFSPSEAGNYMLRLRGVARGSRNRSSNPGVMATLPLHVLETDPLEFVDLSSDTGYLERLAHANGGRCLPIQRLDEVPQLLRDTRLRDSQVTRVPVYSSPLLMAFVLACLSTEWALRKRAGLA